jgi:hypothetical protein
MDSMRAVVILGLLALLGGCSDDGGAADAALEAGSGGEEGFGDYCSDVAKPCKAGFFCSREFGEPFGVCTKKCRASPAAARRWGPGPIAG